MDEVDSPLASDFSELLCRAGRPGKPVNFQNRKAGAIATAAQYALTVAFNLGGSLRHQGVQLEGKRLLEIGPGTDFASTLLLGETCALIAVADRFLAPWQDHYHPALYAAIQRDIGRPSRWLDQVISQQGHDGVLQCIAEPAHALTSIAGGSFDVVISNAVLEHVRPLRETIKELFRITAPGGVGWHQVDFRNHRDFAFPLEHLLLTRDQFQQISAATNHEIGCQERAADMAAFFTESGYEIRAIHVNETATLQYMQNFYPRLQRSHSTYRHYRPDQLDVLSAAFFVVKPEFER